MVLADLSRNELEAQIAALRKQAEAIPHCQRALERKEREVTELRNANAALQGDLKRAQKDALIPRTPSMAEHQELLSRIQAMEERHQSRARELKRVADEIRHRADMDIELVQRRAGVAIEAKNAEIRRFREELDRVMRHSRCSAFATARFPYDTAPVFVMLVNFTLPYLLLSHVPPGNLLDCCCIYVTQIRSFLPSVTCTASSLCMSRVRFYCLRSRRGRLCV